MEKLFIKTTKLYAEGKYINGRLMILKGSRAKYEVGASFPISQISYRDELIAKGVLADQGEFYVFTEDVLCNSASEASNLIIGSSSNGLLSWKDSFGKSLKSLKRNNF